MEINFIGPAGFHGGYAVHGQNLAVAMDNLGVTVNYIPHNEWNAKTEEKAYPRDVIKLIKRKQYEAYDSSLPTIRLDMPEGLRALTAGNPMNYYTTFELSKIPRTWVQYLNQMDNVWTTCSYCKEMFKDSGVDNNIDVIPEGVDSELFKPIKERRGEIPSDKFTFLHIGKWEKRKGIYTLLKAFAEEFDRDEDVALFIQSDNPWEKHNVYQEIFMLNLPRHAQIQPFTLDLDPEELVKLYNSFDCFVSATRGEGWNLPLMEAMSCGLPCIAPKHTGMKEYLTEDNAFNVRTSGKEQVDMNLPGIEVTPGMNWYKVDKEHLKAQMRRAFEEKGEREDKSAKARETALEFTWEKAAKEAIEALG